MTKPMPYRLSVLVALLAAGACTPAAAPAPAAPAPTEDVRISNAVHWTRSAAEHRAIFIQTYRAAAHALRELAAGRQNGTWGVIMDADETLLDNSLFQVRLERQGLAYSEEIWNDWVREEAATALPGAVEFAEHVDRLGGRLVVVTNRQVVVCEPTRRNLEALGIEPDAVLCLDETSDKNPRFRAVQSGAVEGLPPIEVVMWVGDNIQDFPGLTQEIRHAPATAYERFGRTWFVLPNPMYGSWERVEVR